MIIYGNFVYDQKLLKDLIVKSQKSIMYVNKYNLIAYDYYIQKDINTLDKEYSNMLRGVNLDNNMNVDKKSARFG